MDRLSSTEDDANELESVPLPIQTFLWRQTNPFLGAKIGKLHEASCVTFERVVVQNILHGLSPSLSDAIGSVSRWRFVRAAFPHIVQCCASLLWEAAGRERAPMSASLVKMLYILHWLLLDSANECCDSGSRKSLNESNDFGVISVRHYAFSISSIQLFVYLITPLLNVITEKDIISNFRLENGLKIWQSLWQFRQPEVLCFCAPVKQRRSNIPFVTIAKKTQPISATQGIYLGDENEKTIRRLSTAPAQIANFAPYVSAPPPKPPRTDRTVLSSLKKRKEREMAAAAAEQGDNQQNNKKQSPSSETIRSSAIIRSVSDYRTADNASNVRHLFTKSHTAIFADKSPSLCKGMAELDDALNFMEEKSLSEVMADAEVAEKAPLVLLQEICSGISVDLENVSQNGCEIICKECNAVVYRDGTMLGVCNCERRSSGLRYKIVQTGSRNSSDTVIPKLEENTNDTLQRGNTILTLGEEAATKEACTKTVQIELTKEFDPLEKISLGSNIAQQTNSDPQEATYMDVAVIRCLFIKHWSEDGLFWALKYLINRLFEIKMYRNSQDGMYRLRAASEPNIARSNIFSAEMDHRRNLRERQNHVPTWDDLQLDVITKKLTIVENNDGKLKSTSLHAFVKTRCNSTTFSTADTFPRATDTVIKRDSNIASGHVSRNHERRLERNRSDPSLTNSFENHPTRATRSGSVSGLPGQAINELSSRQFFPEALGSSNFIERNGHINFTVLLKAVSLVTERRSSVRICELTLNVCESLQAMPGIDFQSFADDCINIVLRIYSWLGCPHGCNDGLRSPQGDFLRVKARCILATIYRNDSQAFDHLLVSYIEDCNTPTLIDTLHAVTGFCRSDITAGTNRAKSNLSPQHQSMMTDCSVPSYRNNFNEGLKGIEGTVIKIILKPVISKLMKAMNELLQPENMSLYQDVRLFVSFIQQQHGNPFRRVGLSALLDGRPSDNLNQHSKSLDGETTNSWSSRRASFLCPLPEIFVTEGKSKIANNDETEVESKSDNNSEDGSARSNVSILAPPQIRESASLRRGLFKKREKLSNTDDSDVDSSPSTPKNPQTNDDLTITGSSSSPLLPTLHGAKKKSGGKLHFAFHLLKSVRSDYTDDDGSDIDMNDDDKSQNESTVYDERHPKNLPAQKSTSKSLTSRQKSTEFLDDSQESLHSSRTPVVNLNLPSRRLVNLRGIQEGVRRFSFFLETCRPGSFPDPPLLAALLDLKSPVLARASLLLECALFVHQCNKGNWPEWIRSNTVRQLSTYGCGNALGNRGTPSATRRMHMMQRAAGRCFYHWGCQLGDRIHRIMESSGAKLDKTESRKTELNRRELIIRDNLEDFFDEGTVNNESGEGCPPAVLLLACLLLCEISSFMRETFQTIPRSRGTKSVTNPANWDKLMSNRRWSILSNTFSPQQQQLTSSSIQSIADVNPSIHQGDRRISLSTNEEDSSRSSHEPIEEIVQQSDKKARRLAQGRQRLLKRGSPSNVIAQPFDSSDKTRRSIRNRKISRIKGVDEKDGVCETRTASIILPLMSEPLERAMRKASIAMARTFSFSFNLPLHYYHHQHHRHSKPSKSIFTDVAETLLHQAFPSTGGGKCTRDSLKPSDEMMASPEHGQKMSATTLQPSSTQGSSAPRQPHHQQQTQATCDDDEEFMFKNLPWLKVVIDMANSFNLACNHERYCHPWCFERVYRQCYRLAEALRKLYGEDLPPYGRLDKRKAMVDAWLSRQENFKKPSQRFSGILPIRRESAAVRQGAMLDKPPMALRNLIIEKLNEMDENKEGRTKNANNKDSDDLIEASQLKKQPNPSTMLSYMATQMLSIAHAPFSTLLKSCLVLRDEHHRQMMDICWHLLVHRDKHIVASAASLFIVSSVRSPDEAISVVKRSLSNEDANVRTEGLRRFHALWRNRFHVWLKMEDGAQLIFKVPPPGIDFTLPSPPVGQSQVTVVDPPWMPHVKTKVEELSLKEEEQATSQTIMTMTRTRRKQKQEMIRRAVYEADERESNLRQKFPLRATAIVQQAAYEPALFHHQTQQVIADTIGEESDVHPGSSRQQLPVAQPLFPSSLLSVVPTIIEMLDDVQVDGNGKSVSDIAKKIIWSCIVEDSSLFLRHFLEKLTNRDRQEYLMSLLRKLILRFQPLPNQTAFILLNYFFGFVMHYVRSPCDGSNRAIAMALSVAWLVAPHVHGLYFKDLKQTLKKEQCDQALMITANVPSTKKIIVHGPDSSTGGIPSQFPIHEDTQFQQLLTDSLEFFNIPENDVENYFLIDTKTNSVHNPSSYVRDFYFFHRSFYPQLTLVKLDVNEAQMRMRQMAFTQKFTEIGKVLLTHNILANSPENVIPQRIFFLHDEFTHLPSFPRKSLETCFGMYNGTMGRELFSMDSMHKFVWALLMSDMFEKMENAFMFGDLHLFINVINGVMLLHCENVTILRRCMATYISMAIHFNSLFASQGFFLIMPTILRCYSQRQTNNLLCRTIEYVCKQFYILHRKPFLLQMAGAVANILDVDGSDFDVNPMKVKAKYWFNLLRSMEDMGDLNDPIDVLGLVNEAKPLKALDLCYRDDPNTFSLLTDALASAVTVCAFAPESRRCYQMLLVMQATLPYFLDYTEQETLKQSNHMNAVKHELAVYTTLCVEMKALVNCCEILARGPTRTFDIVNSVSERGKSFIADSPQFFDPPTIVEDETKIHYSAVKDKKSVAGWDSVDNSEVQREAFRRPRDALLVLAATFIEKAGPRLKELIKLASNIEHVKIPEIFDHKCHVKLSEIALALLKIAPYDFNTMSCLGLQKYFTAILPITDWSVEGNRSTLNFILRRLDKTIQKIGKKLVLRRRINLAALTSWLNGLHRTLVAYPYIAHLQPLKTTTQMCLRIMVGDPCGEDLAVQSNIALSTVLHGMPQPQSFCNAVLKLASFLMQALGQAAFSLEHMCGSEGIGPTAERLEAVLCHILIPLFLRAAATKKDALSFHTKDLIFCLNLMQNAVNPPLAKQSLGPTVSSNLASTLIRGSNTHDASGRQGSVSVTERGHSATVSTHRLIRETVCQAIFLALKVMIIAFEKQMTTLWPRVLKIIRELLNKKIGGAALYSFVDFVVDVNLPISLIILPFLQSKVMQKASTEHEAAWQAEFKERLNSLGGASCSEIRGYGALLAELSQELQSMKEDFSTRTFEIARSHTPTVTEVHSDSGSTQSTGIHRLSCTRTGTNELRRLSSTAITKQNRITPSTHHKEAASEKTIVEDTEDEYACTISSTKTTTKSPTKNAEKRTSLELHYLPPFPKQQKSSGRYSRLEETLVLPLNLEKPMVASEFRAPCQAERPKIVSFTTPARHQYDSNDDDFVDRITARHHYV